MARDVKWSWDETVLALEFYLRHHPQPPGKDSPELIALSALLNRLGEANGVPRSAKFRNPNGVYMKLMNFRRHDIDFIESGRKGLERGAALEDDVVTRYWFDRPALSFYAAALRAAVGTQEAKSQAAAEEEDSGTEEGGLVLRLHRARERAPGLASKKRQSVIEKTGKLECEVCGFDFALRFGSRGVGFIEVHHNVPLGSIASARKTKLADLACVCSNCHRMLHRGGLLTVEELRDRVQQIDCHAATP